MGNSKGYAFITFKSPEDAKIAHAQTNGFEIAGRPIKVAWVMMLFNLNDLFPYIIS